MPWLKLKQQLESSLFKTEITLLRGFKHCSTNVMPGVSVMSAKSSEFPI